MVVHSFLLSAVALAVALPAAAAPAGAMKEDAWEAAEKFPGKLAKGDSSAAALRVQTLLDRLHFSPGAIDGVFGEMTARALAEYQRVNGLKASGRLDKRTWRSLNQDAGPTLTAYTVTDNDVRGPFEKIPEDMMEQAKLDRLGHESALEALAERFHASQDLIEKLNPSVKIEEGAEIAVPDVSRPELPKAARVEVIGSHPAVFVYGPGDSLLAYYPATAGSEKDPLPVGEWKIRGVARDPQFHYNPDLFWDSDPDHSKAILPAGPNNPVGVVWIDLSKEHYGIHGTPSPELIGRVQSHGCIRLTNWDASSLADAVGPGVPVKIAAERTRRKKPKE